MAAEGRRELELVTSLVNVNDCFTNFVKSCPLGIAGEIRKQQRGHTELILKTFPRLDQPLQTNYLNAYFGMPNPFTRYSTNEDEM